MGVVFSGEEGMKHCTECDSPELFDGEINQYGVCFGCADGDPEAGKPEPPTVSRPQQPFAPHDHTDRRAPYWMRSGRHG